MKEARVQKTVENCEKIVITIDASNLPGEEAFVTELAENIGQILRQKHRRHTRRGDETFGYTVKVITE